MQTIYLIISIASAILGTVLPAIIGFLKAVKARKLAQTEAEKQKANADLLATAQGFIKSAEETFVEFDRLLKAQQSSAGPMKKESVMTKLQAYAIQNGYEFDTEFWSAKIDEIVEFTKAVNARK